MVKTNAVKAEATERQAGQAGMDPLALAQLGNDVQRDQSEMASDDVAVKVGVSFVRPADGAHFFFLCRAC